MYGNKEQLKIVQKSKYFRNTIYKQSQQIAAIEWNEINGQNHHLVEKLKQQTDRQN